jgi:hypothetical protein
MSKQALIAESMSDLLEDDKNPPPSDNIDDMVVRVAQIKATYLVSSPNLRLECDEKSVVLEGNQQSRLHLYVPGFVPTLFDPVPADEGETSAFEPIVHIIKNSKHSIALALISTDVCNHFSSSPPTLFGCSDQLHVAKP